MSQPVNVRPAYYPYDTSRPPAHTSGAYLSHQNHQNSPYGSPPYSTLPSPNGSSSTSGSTPSTYHRGAAPPAPNSPQLASDSTSASVDRRKTPSSWSPDDDLVLRHLKEQLKLGWKEIASHFPNRTTNACQFRWRRLISGNLRQSAPGSIAPPQSGGPSSAQRLPIHPGNGANEHPHQHSQQHPGVPAPPPPPPMPLHHHHPGVPPPPPPPPPHHMSYSYPPPPPPPPPPHHHLHQRHSLPSTTSSSSGSTTTATSPSIQNLPQAGPPPQLHIPVRPPSPEASKPWNNEEDEMILRNDLRIEELSVLLPSRTEAEIRDRSQQLKASSSADANAVAKQPTPPPTSATSPTSTSTSANSSSSALSSESAATSISSQSRPSTFASPTTTTRPNLSKGASFFDGLKLPTPIVQNRRTQSTPALETSL